MFTRSDLAELVTIDTDLGVSIFLPTHTAGRETRQDPIRLKNLAHEAREKLLECGMSPPDADKFLAPVTDLVNDFEFWQHQDQGLAMFLDGTVHVHKVPIELPEQVVVGANFHLKPLLPLFSGDGEFRVLTATAGEAGLYKGSRFSLVEDTSVELPDGFRDPAVESDFENNAQTHPYARPRVGGPTMSNAQIYGDAPPEWRKTQLLEYTRNLASALDSLSATHPVPVVIVADPEVGGHVRHAIKHSEVLAGMVEKNPAALDSQELHDMAYEVVQERLDAARVVATDQFAALLGQSDTRAATSVEDIVSAAYQGRVDTLLLRMEPVTWGHYDLATDSFSWSNTDDADNEDLYERAALETLQHGGSVQFLSDADLPDVEAGAILRY